MRCKACDAEMTTHEMVIREETGEFEELCLVCKKASMDDSIDDGLVDLPDVISIEELVRSEEWES